MNTTLFKNGQWLNFDGGAQITGEKIPGDLDSWSTFLTDINKASTLSYGKLQKRSTTLYHTYAPIASAINKTTAYAIGSGNVFRSRPDHRVLGISEDDAKEWGKQFQSLVHYIFEDLGWYEKQSVVFRSALITGDSLVYFIRDKNGLDLIDGGGDAIKWEKTEGDLWTLGIRHDKYKRRNAIYTEKQLNFKNKATGDQQVIQFLIKEMSRQLRGFPLAYKIIALAKGHDRHMDATVQRAVLESILMAYSNTDATDMNAQLLAQAEAAKGDQKGIFKTALNKLTGTQELSGGGIFQLKTDEKVEFTKMETPGSQFGVFNEWMIKFVAMATDTTPGIIMSNYPTSYSAHRGEFNDFWAMVKYKRNVFNKKVNKVVIGEIAKQLILNGTIKAPGFFNDPIKQQAWLAGAFIGPVPGHLNPRQEVEAHRIAVEQSFALRGDIANLYGNEWNNSIGEWGSQEKQFKTESLTDAEIELMKKDLQNV